MAFYPVTYHVFDSEIQTTQVALPENIKRRVFQILDRNHDDIIDQFEFESSRSFGADFDSYVELLGIQYERSMGNRAYPYIFECSQSDFLECSAYEDELCDIEPASDARIWNAYDLSQGFRLYSSLVTYLSAGQSDIIRGRSILNRVSRSVLSSDIDFDALIHPVKVDGTFYPEHFDRTRYHQLTDGRIITKEEVSEIMMIPNGIEYVFNRSHAEAASIVSECWTRQNLEAQFKSCVDSMEITNPNTIQLIHENRRAYLESGIAPL